MSSKVSHSVSVQDDSNDDEDQQQHCYHDNQLNVAIYGGVDVSEALLELSAGKGESIELSSSTKRNIKMKPLNEAVVKETQSTGRVTDRGFQAIGKDGASE